MVKLKRLHQNRSFSIKCSSFCCNKPAVAYFAYGLVKGLPKKGCITNSSTLFRVSMNNGCCIPMCAEHIKIQDDYLMEIGDKKRVKKYPL